VPNTPTLTINGLELPYWSSVTVDRSIDAVADSFTIEYGNHEADPGGEINPLSFDGDEPVEIRLEDELLLTGYIDASQVAISTDGTTVSLSGNSKTVDLVSCPVMPPNDNLNEKTIESICRVLCKPFGIDVEVDEGSEAAAQTVLARFKAEFGEDVIDAIERAAQYRGLVVSSAPNGNLRLGLSAASRIETEIRLPGNLLSVSVSRDARQRYSDYYVSNGAPSDIEPDEEGQASGTVAHVEDPGVSRHRPLHLEPNTGVSKQSQRVAQAEAERNRRVGQSLVISGSMPGWKHSGGVWAPNTLVAVSIKKGPLKIEQEMVITTARLVRDASSSKVELELVHPSALKPDDVPLPRRRRKRKKAADPTVDQTELEAEFGDLGDYAELGDSWTDAETNPF